jgi:hypothetical protein
MWEKKRSLAKMMRKHARRQQIEHPSQEKIESIVYPYPRSNEVRNEKEMKPNL